MRSRKIIAFVVLCLFGLAIASLALLQNLPESPPRYGYIDFTGKVVIPMIYRNATYFQEGLAEVSLNGKEYGYIDKTGKVVIPFKFYRTYGFSEGLAYFSETDDADSLWGFIDRTGRVVIPPQFEKVNRFRAGLAAVVSKKDNPLGLWGFIDRTGKMVLPPKYFNDFDDIHFSEGLAAVETMDSVGKKKGYIDRTGKVVIPLQYVFAQEFVNGFAKVDEPVPGKSIQEETTEYCINKLGVKVSVKFCSRKNIKIHDPEGKLPFNVVYKQHIQVTGQLKYIKDETTGLYGYRDDNRNLIIPYQFKDAGPFSEGLAYVSK